MGLRKMTVAILFMLTTSLGVQMPAMAQQAATPTQRAGNIRATSDLRDRIGVTDFRITIAQRGEKITPARAMALHRQVARMQTEVKRLSLRQGFVSTAQLATYGRTLTTIEGELDRRGVERGYGDDMLSPSTGPKPG